MTIGLFHFSFHSLSVFQQVLSFTVKYLLQLSFVGFEPRRYVQSIPVRRLIRG